MGKVKQIILCLLLATPAIAQKAVISVTIDSAQLLVGEQTRIHLDIAANRDARLQLPLHTETLMEGVEVLEISKFDTTDIGNNRVQIRYDYLITSFDSALYLLPPFAVVEGLDTVYSQRLALKVSSVPVDVSSKQFYDIKDVLTPAFVWQDHLSTALYVWGALVVLLLIIYVIYRIKKHKPIIPMPKKEKIVLPPHVQAIKALDEIKSGKLWQQGKEKEFHSQVSDVIREYLHARFGIDALEQVSGETLEQVRTLSEANAVYNNLKQLLLTADLVKFAKYSPLADENETSLMNAYLFVNETTPQPLPEQGRNDNRNS